jgi:hypothetical protein
VIETLLFAVWFFLPAGAANATPVFINKIPLLRNWKTPLDCGKTLNGKRLFGANKTWRGLIFGTLVGALTGLLIYGIYPTSANELNFTTNGGLRMFCLGALLGAGALLGDALESMAKRQLGVQPGESWFPFDQLDYIFGGIVFSSVLYVLQPYQSLAIIAVYFGLHLVVSYLGFLLNLKDKPI